MTQDTQLVKKDAVLTAYKKRSHGIVRALSIAYFASDLSELLRAFIALETSQFDFEYGR